MKIRLVNNKNTSSKDWTYLLPGIGIAKKHIMFYWIKWLLDIQYKE